MIEKLNSKIRPLLEIFDRLKDVLKLAKIKTPIIATCGMQSHGKSSTLESITKIQLPTKAETCTICPIKICLRETKEKPYYNIKLEDEEYIENDMKLTNFKKLKDKIDEYQTKVKKACGLKDQKITSKKIIQLDVYKNDVPNLNLYDLPGVTFVEGIKEEAEKIYEDFLEDEDTTVLLILNGGDDLTNSSVIDWMKKIKNYRKRFIPIVAKADLIKNFEGKYKQLMNMKLNNKPCLIINKCNDVKELKNLSDNDEVKKIKEVIPNIDQYPVILGRRKLIDELIKIQYEKYKENFKDIIDNINNEIKRNEDRLSKLPQEYELKEDFCDSFIEIFEKLLNSFKTDIVKFKKGPVSPEGNLLKREIKKEFQEFIIKAKEKINEFFTLEFCNYVTKNTKDTNCDNISILEDTIPFKRLIIPEIKEILKTFEEIINNIYKKITNKIEDTIKKAFEQYINLRYKVSELYRRYSEIQQEKMKKLYDEICLLETSNITSFDLELNYKCDVLVRKIMNFLYKKEDEEFLPLKEEQKENNEMNQIKEKSEENNNLEKKEEIKEEDIKENNVIDTSDNKISDERYDIIKGVKNINNLLIQKFKELTKQTVDKLTEEVISNPNYKNNVKQIYEEHKSDITQIVGIINNYEIEQLTRIYDSIGSKGRPKMAYNPENVTTFEERIEDIELKEKDEYEFIPGYQFIKNESLNTFIDFFKSGKVLPKIANTIVKMVAYAEVMCNRIIDIIFLSIQNHLYDDLTNDKMIKFLRNEMHKFLFRINFDECKKLLEVNREIAEEIKTCQNNIKKLKASKDDIEIAHAKFYEDEIQEKDQKINEEKKNDNEEENDAEENNLNNKNDSGREDEGDEG